MAVEAKQIVTHIRNGLVFAIRTTYRSARDHPFAWGLLLFLLLLYSSFPSLFAFLVSSSPVIGCTTLLLGLLLSYGEPKLPDIEDDKWTHEISSLKAGTLVDDLVVRRDDSLAVEAHVESSSDDEDEGDESEVYDMGFVGEREFSVEKQAEGVVEVGQDVAAGVRECSVEKQGEGGVEVRQDVDVGVSADDEEEFMGGITVKIGRPGSEENHFDSSLGSPWQPINVHDASSDSESDRAESSSPDASMTDIIPMLDELHPLIDSDYLQPAHDSDAGSVEEEAEHREGHEDEETHEEKDDANEEVVKWNADDQKNVMDLGISEIERNQRLESLIARRRARKDLRFITERNLIDLDYPVRDMDELSRFQARIPPISAPRQNPFDLPFELEENACLHPTPGSAPSVLQLRHNPFDLPYDQVAQSSSLTAESLGHGEFLSVPHRDMFFRRHGSFGMGAPFAGEFNQERRPSRLKPHFDVELAEEASFPTFQRQLSEMSDSKESSVPESDTATSGMDHKHHRELLEEGLHQESEMLLPANNDAGPIVQEIQFSEEVDSVDVDYKQSGINVGDDYLVAEESHQAAHASLAVREEIREQEHDSSISHAAKLEVIEDKYDESSPFSLEADEKSFKMNIYEESVNLEHADGVALKGSIDSGYSLPTDSNFPSMVLESVDDGQAADTINDSSLSSIGKSLSKMSSFDEPLFDGGKGGLNFISSLASEMPTTVSDVTSTLWQLENNASTGASESVNKTMIEDLESISGGVEVASPNVSCIDENESRLRDMAAEVMHPSSLPSVDTESTEDDPVDVDTSFPSKGGEMTGAATSCSDTFVLFDHLTSFATEKIHPLSEYSTSQSSSEAGLVESQINILNLPSIPEENLEDFKLEEEHESMKESVGVVGLTGLQMIKEPDAGLPDIKQELSSFQRKSAEGTEDIENTNRLVHEAEDNDALVVSPINSSHDSSLSGVCLPATTEILESSSLLDMKYELEIKSHGASCDSRGDGFPKMVNNSNEESDEVHSEIRAIEGIDERLLSELDAVGDFLAEERKSDGSSPQMELQYNGKLVGNDAYSLIKEDFPTWLEVSEARPLEDVRLLPSEANLIDLDELPPVANQPNAMEWQVGSSSWPTGVDLDMTMYNSKLHDLEACSFEELDSVFKRLREAAVMPCNSDPIGEKSVTATQEVGYEETDITDRDPKVMKTDSELQVLEAKSIEDIYSAFQQLSEGSLDKSVIPDVEASESLATKMHSEKSVTATQEARSNEMDIMDRVPKLMKTDSELHVLEAKSIEDINSALEQLSEGSLDKSVIPDVEPSDSLATRMHMEKSVTATQEAGPGETDITDNDPKLMKTNSELQILEAKSIEDINSAFQQLSEGSLDKSVTPDVEPSDSLTTRMHRETMEAHSDLHKVEAVSLEDLHLALKQLTEGTAENPMKPVEHKDAFAVIEASERPLEPEVLEVQSAEQIRLALEAAVDGETWSIHGQNNKKPHEVETVADSSSTGASSSRTVQKKDKSGKSGSSSSSSSSDSE